MSGSDKAGRTGHKSEQFPAALEKFAAGSCLWGIRAKISALLVYEERTKWCSCLEHLMGCLSGQLLVLQGKERNNRQRGKWKWRQSAEQREEMVPVCQGKRHLAEQTWGQGARLGSLASRVVDAAPSTSVRLALPVRPGVSTSPEWLVHSWITKS